jgi:dTDP-4-amino-4,6-dideoxygalactose transaminase
MPGNGDRPGCFQELRRLLPKFPNPDFLCLHETLPQRLCTQDNTFGEKSRFEQAVPQPAVTMGFSMRVPMLDVRRENDPIAGELREACSRVVASGHYILGPEVEAFEEAAAAVAGARFAVGLSSGTDAILAALMAFEIGPDDEVICPSFTFFATAGCIARVGARPVFADSRPECFNIDPAGIEALITPRTRAIIPVHLFGQAADMDAIMEIARRHHLRVIEDAAQAFGAEYRGKPVGAIGDCGTVSFYPSKNLGAFGDAGLLVTNDAAIAERVRLLRNHGAQQQYFHSVVGGNFRIDAMQAALLRVKLPLLAGYTARRQQHACEYQRLLKGLEITLPVTRPDRTHIANQYTVRVRSGRDELHAFLADRGIGSAVYYPVPLHRQECFRKYGPYPPLPVSEALAREALSLPVFPGLTAEEQGAVAQAIVDFYQRR